LTQFKLQPNLTVELEKNLESSEEILRYLLVRLEE
jgi:ribosomal protein S6